ncbi:MAG: MATE family efflux transporter [Victivallales bacterium]|nr:MATE family efflux transporter [Victivallales bacterium]
MALKDSTFLGTENVSHLLLRLSWPAVVSTVINMLYNIVDRIYIGNGVGKEALAGLALTMPIMIIIAAFGMMGGVGTSAVISIFLGQQKKHEAEKALGQLMFLCLMSVVTIQFLALIFLDKILAGFGGNEASIPYAHSYLRIILWGSVFQHLSFSFAAQLRAEGNARKCMVTILIGAISNIILDPIFIFVFKLGIAGAAYATILSMMISSSFVLYHFITGKGVIRLRLKNIIPNPRLIWRIVSIGLSPCCGQFAASAINIAANRCFNTYSATTELANEGIACWSIVLSVNFIFITPLFGLAQGMQPIVGYNFGSRNWLRVRQAYKTALCYGLAICCCSTAILVTFAPYFVKCFNQTPSLVAMGSRGIRIEMITFSFIAIDILTYNYFQAIGRAGVSICLSLLRQVVFFLPSLIILSHFTGIENIWWCLPISDGAALLCSSTIAICTLRSLKRKAAAMAA